LSSLRDLRIYPVAKDGLGLYLNLFGAPALSVKDFASYKQNTIIGLSLAVTAPAVQYDSQRLVNIGANRWSLKPEIGISKALGPLSSS
jgi:hypothetical protein